MYAFRSADPVHRGHLLLGLSVRCIGTGQAIFDVRCENPDSCKILASRSIGTPAEVIAPHKPSLDRDA